MNEDYQRPQRNTKSGMDLPKPRSSWPATPNTLNNDQRNQLVDIMAGQASPPSSTPGSAHMRSRRQRPRSRPTDR